MVAPILSRSGLFSLVGVLLLLAPPVSGASLYRWSGPDGATHYGDNPPNGTKEHRLVEIAVSPSFYRVEKVFDGDTVRLADGRKVRLIGINTPEVAHRNRPAQRGGEEAKRFLTKRLEGRRIRLEFGPEREDKYGRLLAHIYDEDGVNINRLMLEQGLAHAVIKPPSLTHVDEYFDVEVSARRRGLGIWSDEAYRAKEIGDAAQFRNSFRRLKGKVVGVEEKRSAWLLLFQNRVKGLIRKEHLESFIEHRLHPKDLVGEVVILRGWVHRSKGHPLIRLRHRHAIEASSLHTEFKGNGKMAD